MKTLSNLTIGTKLEMVNQLGTFGTYSDIVVTNIKETKSGRLVVSLEMLYTYNGAKKIVTRNMGHSALDKATLLSNYDFIIK